MLPSRLFVIQLKYKCFCLLYSGFHTAVIHGQLEVLRQLLRAYAKVNTTGCQAVNAYNRDRQVTSCNVDNFATIISFKLLK